MTTRSNRSMAATMAAFRYGQMRRQRCAAETARMRRGREGDQQLLICTRTRVGWKESVAANVTFLQLEGRSKVLASQEVLDGPAVVARFLDWFGRAGPAWRLHQSSTHNSPDCNVPHFSSKCKFGLVQIPCKSTSPDNRSHQTGGMEASRGLVLASGMDVNIAPPSLACLEDDSPSDRSLLMICWHRGGCCSRRDASSFFFEYS
jgi:hypothetical protein